MVASYNGWTASPDASAIGINTKFTVLGVKPFRDGGFAGGIKAGAVEVVFRYLITRLHYEVEPMQDKGSGLGYGCWAYEYRANVNNPSTLSCHASGTAIDYNANLHPNGTSTGPNGGGGWTGAQYRAIQGILADLGGVIRWLTGNDPMHFEIYGSAAAVEAVAQRIAKGDAADSTNGGGTVPTTPSAPTDWWDTVDETQAVAAMEKAVRNVLGRGGLIDGIFITDVIADTWNRGKGQQALLERIITDVSEYDAIVYQDKNGLWWSEAGVSRPIPDPETLKALQYVASQTGKKVLLWPGGDVDMPGAFGAQGESGSIPGPDPEHVIAPSTYTVVSGDTFNAIAKSLGVTPEALKAANPQVTNPSTLDVGQVLSIPRNG